MDRGKSGRGGKSSKSHFLGSGELIALGKNTRPGTTSSTEGATETRKPSSSGSSSTSSSKPLGSASKLFSGGSSSSSKISLASTSDRKREGLAPQHEHPSKKSRIHGSSSSSSLTSTAQPSSSKSSSTSSSSHSLKPAKPVKRDSLDTLNIKAEDLHPDVFYGEVEKADKHKDFERAQNLLLGAVKRLKSNREKPDLRLCEALMLTSKVYPHLWHSGPSVIDALSSLATFRRSGSATAVDVKLKASQQNLSIFAPVVVNILANANSKNSSWPTVFVQLWVEDACGDRFWVDTAHCKTVVDNIVYSFGTVVPNPNLLPTGDGGLGTQVPSGASSPSLGLSDDSHIQLEATQILDEQKSELPVTNRYTGKDSTIETIITDHANDVLTKKTPEIPRNLVRALGQACGLSGVRSFVVNRLEQWLHNPKCGRQAQELLLHLCVNANCNTTTDADIVTQISKLRMKTKQLMMFHAVAVREMVRENDVNLRHVLNQVIYNELSPQRHPNNLPILGSIISGCPESRTVLAGIFLDLLTKREDFHPALRLLFREILRNCRFECDLTKFLKGLIRNKPELTWPNEVRERAFLAIADLILLCMFLSVSPQVREASMVRGDSKDQTTLNNFRKCVANMQNDAVSWLYTEVPKTFMPSKSAFLHALHKLILKDPANDLVTKENWPPDAEKALFGRLVLDVPISENVIIWLSLMGLQKEHPVLPREVFDYIELLLIRAATHRSALKFQKPEIYELLFRLSEYKHPDEIILPEGYEPPKLAISKLYWQAWLILCILAAHNPQGFGKLGWEEYPTLRMLMEMCMTNQFQFPTAASTENVEDLMSKEIQIAALEKQEILEFETHLAAASSKQTINERNSLLLSQLMRLDPLGQPRNPQQQFLAQLQHLNVDLHLGHLLCRSRNPDFLLDLIQKNSQPMPWLSQLVSEGSFDMLPIQCLCEFLLGQTEKLLKPKGADVVKSEEVVAPEKSPRKHAKGTVQAPELPKDTKTLQLLQHLQTVVHNAGEPSDAKEVVEYFLRRLASPKVQSRSQAVQGLQLLFSNPGKVEPIENWLMDCLPSLPIFPEIQAQVLVLLRQALQMETEPQLVFKYIEFLNIWGPMIENDISGLASDIAQLVVERNILTSVMLRNDPAAFEPFFNILLAYTKKIRGPQKAEYRWTDNEDMLLVRWSEEQLEAILNNQIIAAIVIVIVTYTNVSPTEMERIGPGKDIAAQIQAETKFNELMNIWFPLTVENSPKGFLLNTTEEVMLYPLWLRLRMARTDNPRLIQASIVGLNMEQLIVFFQTFGFPKKCMSALLFCLDAHVDQNKDAIKALIKNPQFMQTLVEVQWQKGVAGGEKFYEILQQLTGIKNTDTLNSSLLLSRSRPLRPQLNIPTYKDQSRNYPKLKSTAQQSINTKQLNLSRLPRNDTSLNASGPTSSYESEICDEETSRMKIANLSKQLYALTSPPSSRRRSSVPVDPNSFFDDSISGIRRHSSHCDSSSANASSEICVAGSANNLGELVDSITYFEPCIVRHSIDYQLPLLFGRSEIHPNCRSFLMTVLTHQAGWETVENLISLFLREFDSTYDPATVLDLISATNSNPKLWQGVDKYVPRHLANVSPFRLTENQLIVMAEYIVEEIGQLEMRSTKFSITNLLGPSQPTKNTKTVRSGLQERVKLWLQCCQQDKEIVDLSISNLMSRKEKNPCAKKMIAQVYVDFPEIIFVENWASKAEEMNFTEEEITCVLDTVSHSLITAIANTQPGKDWSKKASHEIEICLRKLGAVHPTLLLRQVPLMSTLLEGRVHLEFSAFHQQNHHIPFVVYLGLLDLMQPHVLKNFQILKSALSLYFKLFQNYGHLKDYSSSLSRFSVLLHNFLSANPKEVKEYLSSYYNTLRELSLLKYYMDVFPLQNLLSFLVPPNMVSDLSAAAPTQVKNMSTDVHYSSYISTLTDRFLHVSNHDEIIPILQDLETFSTRNPSALHHFSDHLSSLLSSESDCCRNLALSLIMKHMTYSPGSCTSYLESVIQALQSRNSHVRDTILDRIHEFIILCQENGEEILMKIFDLGVSANINVLPALRKSMNLLRNYSGVN